jgi:hypothetical protein
MLSLEDTRALERWEDSYLNEPDYDDHETDWDEADRVAEEKWIRRLYEEDL